MVRIKGHQNSTKIGDVLANCLVAVHVQAWKRFERTVLPTQLGGTRIEFAGVSIRPPIRKRTGSVVLPAIIVKAMDQLMADSSTDPPIVDRRVSRWIEVWSLQLPGWQDYLIEVELYSVFTVCGVASHS